MHSLDKYINDLEPRIISICKSVPTQEEPSLQSSLSSYGWILLDSWVAWRTLRFLLKDTTIEDETQDKWIQTPSSYNANQLRAAWKWDSSVTEYLEERTGKSWKHLIDNTIQKKRNSCAHFNRKSDVTGADSREIKLIFDVLSVVFGACELDAFINAVDGYLLPFGYRMTRVFVGEIDIELAGIHTVLSIFEQIGQVRIVFRNREDKEFELLITKSGCCAGARHDNGVNWKDVVNDRVDMYSLLGNKGFYLDKELFCNTIMTCWKD